MIRDDASDACPNCRDESDKPPYHRCSVCGGGRATPQTLDGATVEACAQVAFDWDIDWSVGVAENIGRLGLTIRALSSGPPARYFTCTCKGPKHGSGTGCSGTGAEFTGGLCGWCIAECRRTDGPPATPAVDPGCDADRCRYVNEGMGSDPVLHHRPGCPNGPWTRVMNARPAPSATQGVSARPAREGLARRLGGILSDLNEAADNEEWIGRTRLALRIRQHAEVIRQAAVEADRATRTTPDRPGPATLPVVAEAMERARWHDFVHAFTREHWPGSHPDDYDPTDEQLIDLCLAAACAPGDTRTTKERP